jgi:hypothetical protein
MFVLDRSGMADIAKSDQIRKLVREAAREVAGHARDATDLPVETSERTTDRAVVDVTIAHPAGAATQAKYGVLTRAAARAGLDVRSRR